jgi:outer membrane protein OmpA-like peptidoglycan-associated protein
MSKKANIGMTKNQKIAFGIGGVIIVAVLGYGFYRKYKYNKLKKQCEDSGGTWDSSTKTCIPPQPKPAPDVKKPVEAIAQDSLLFKSGKSVILQSSFNSLNQLAKWLKENAQFNLNLVGHTDSQGAESYNLKLSQNRAKAVKEYLENQGVGATRILSSGKGESEPISTNDTAEGRAKNRRVEFTIK